MNLRRACRLTLPSLVALPLAAPLAAAPASAITEQKLEVLDPERLSTFGGAVAVYKNLAVVGAPNAYSGPDTVGGGENWSGAVYVFRKRLGGWVEDGRLAPADGSPQDPAYFGGAVATDGKTIVVGGRALDNGGAAYVFERVGGAWTQVARLTAATKEGDGFGWAVAVDGDTIAVGAPYAGPGDGSGEVYLFTRRAGPEAGSGWERAGKLERQGGNGGESSYLTFGRSLDISGDHIVVGAPGHDGGHEDSDTGTALVFSRQAGGWIQEAMLLASDGLRFLYFGEDVAIDKKTIVVGSRGDWDEAGAAYVFEETGAGWVERIKLIANEATAGDWAGADAVAVHKRRIVLGAPLDGEAGDRAGAIYLFRKMGPNWVETDRLLPPDGRAGHQFGGAVAVFKKSILVGAENGDSGDQVGVGAAYAFE
jgi:FG-GAP repeat